MNNPVVNDDDIDLYKIVLRVLARWKIYLLIILTLWTCIAAFVFVYPATTNKVLRQEIRLFGLENTYPNGVPFTINDFKEPVILRELFHGAGLTEIDESQYTDIIDIRRTYKDTEFLTQKYQIEADLISASKDPDALAQIQQLALERDAAIASLNPDTYTMQVNYEQFGLDKEAASLLLEQWPIVWQKHLIKEYRVLSDLFLNSMSLVNREYLGNPEAAYYARQQLEFIRKNVKQFSDDTRFKKMVSEDGRTPIELLRGIQEYDQVLFTPLYSSVLSIDSALSEFYLQDQELAIVQLDKQIESLQGIVDDITTMEIGVRSRAGSQSTVPDDGDIIQIGDGTLNDIVGLVQKASLQDFLTTTLERRHQLVVQKTSIEKQLAQVSGNNLLTEEFISSVSDIHNQIMNEYNDLLEKAYELVIDDRIQMFSYVSASYEKGGQRLHPKTPLFALLPIALLIPVIMIFALIPLKSEKVEA